MFHNHQVLFPWMTPKLLQRMRNNRGISEFSWVYSGQQDRVLINDYCSDHRVITIPNTTWVPHTKGLLEVNNGQHICEKLTCLPNINEQDKRQVIWLANVLTQFCETYPKAIEERKE